MKAVFSMESYEDVERVCDMIEGKASDLLKLAVDLPADVGERASLVNLFHHAGMMCHNARTLQRLEVKGRAKFGRAQGTKNDVEVNDATPAAAVALRPPTQPTDFADDAAADPAAENWFTPDEVFKAAAGKDWTGFTVADVIEGFKSFGEALREKEAGATPTPSKPSDLADDEAGYPEDIVCALMAIDGALAAASDGGVGAVGVCAGTLEHVRPIVATYGSARNFYAGCVLQSDAKHATLPDCAAGVEERIRRGTPVGEKDSAADDDAPSFSNKGLLLEINGALAMATNEKFGAVEALVECAAVLDRLRRIVLAAMGTPIKATFKQETARAKVTQTDVHGQERPHDVFTTDRFVQIQISGKGTEAALETAESVVDHLQSLVDAEDLNDEEWPAGEVDEEPSFNCRCTTAPVIAEIKSMAAERLRISDWLELASINGRDLARRFRTGEYNRAAAEPAATKKPLVDPVTAERMAAIAWLQSKDLHPQTSTRDISKRINAGEHRRVKHVASPTMRADVSAERTAMYEFILRPESRNYGSRALAELINLAMHHAPPTSIPQTEDPMVEDPETVATLPDGGNYLAERIQVVAWLRSLGPGVVTPASLADRVAKADHVPAPESTD